MDYLLDTHTFLWFLDGDTLPESTAQKIKNGSNNIFLNVASLWEISIKISLGKLQVTGGGQSLISALSTYNFEVLPITPQHLDVLIKLPHIHHDPFDRMIIAQAIAENLPVITKDRQFGNYDVKTTW